MDRYFRDWLLDWVEIIERRMGNDQKGGFKMPSRYMA
jgi:hypothetical protein